MYACVVQICAGVKHIYGTDPGPFGHIELLVCAGVWSDWRRACQCHRIMSHKPDAGWLAMHLYAVRSQ